jgi:hypothetical protein
MVKFSLNAKLKKKRKNKKNLGSQKFAKLEQLAKKMHLKTVLYLYLIWGYKSSETPKKASNSIFYVDYFLLFLAFFAQQKGRGTNFLGERVWALLLLLNFELV